MRPPEFTGGKSPGVHRAHAEPGCFNEAAGIHRRKVATGSMLKIRRAASMRPPEFTGGKPIISHPPVPRYRGFNEAAGIHRRKGGQGTGSVVEVLGLLQ